MKHPVSQNAHAHDVRRFVGQRIKGARARQGLTAIDLATDAHVSIGTVRNVESGATEIGFGAMLDLFWALDFSADDVLAILAEDARARGGAA
ncbi:helix-turn-helix domain-containing protein [Gluconacetobacter sp.]|uniref:helix-turn-helix domain-containing protein n=1 Tax=Gluconacetobacter sp. TaxID=1935994 RepID=UPI0039EA2C3D